MADQFEIARFACKMADLPKRADKLQKWLVSLKMAHESQKWLMSPKMAGQFEIDRWADEKMVDRLEYGRWARKWPKMIPKIESIWKKFEKEKCEYDIFIIIFISSSL